MGDGIWDWGSGSQLGGNPVRLLLARIDDCGVVAGVVAW